MAKKYNEKMSDRRFYIEGVLTKAFHTWRGRDFIIRKDSKTGMLGVTFGRDKKAHFVSQLHAEMFQEFCEIMEDV